MPLERLSFVKMMAIFEIINAKDSPIQNIIILNNIIIVNLSLIF